MKTNIVRVCAVTFVLFLLVLIASCDVAAPEENGPKKLSPPSWIIGSWSDAYSVNNYEFRTDNVIFSTSGSSTDFNSVYGSLNPSEEKSDTLYKITISNPSSEYTFSKTSATTLDYTVRTNGTTAGPIVLTKQ